MRTDQLATLDRGNSEPNEIRSGHKLDKLCVQKLYIFQGRAAGLDSKYRTNTAGESQIRTATTTRNKAVDAMLISQLSDEDTITL